jgi:S1-C subfamily serine protease
MRENAGLRSQWEGSSFMKYMAAVLLLVATMSAQKVLIANKKGRLDIPTISRKANGAVVSIIMLDKEEHPVAQGSGFLISTDGHVVTNYHVIREGVSAIVKLPNGASFHVDGVLASDKNRDVAIIKAHGVDFRTLSLGDSGRLQVGEEVVAIGNPLSLESTVSNGIVSAFRTDENEGGKFVQITAPISPGSSGGPLFNMAGEVVGITTSHIKGGENLNFAIPINALKPMLLSRLSKVQSLPEEAEPAIPEQTTGGSLAETLEWMHGTIGNGDYGRNYNSEVEVSFTYGVPTPAVWWEDSSCDVHVTYSSSGEKDSELIFNLQDIDPESITLKTEDPDVACGNYCKDLPKSPIAASVSFSTTNDNKAIADWSYLLGKHHDKSEGGFMFIEAYGPRFKKAFEHAVRLCGGKPSTF